MILWPAVDILAGKAVRLEQGRFGSETVYDDDPLEAARRWVAEGARALHVVDLDGARAGAPVNFGQIESIAARIEVPIQVGGGVRTAAAARAVMEAGADRVVLGTAAYTDPELLEELVDEHGDRVVVSLDARGGRLARSGWVEETDMAPEQLAERLRERGVRHLIYSSIERDGTLGGPDLDAIRGIAASPGASLIYSGGVGSLDDLAALARLRQGTPALAGVIVGKALYERRFTVREGQHVLEGCTTSA